MATNPVQIEIASPRHFDRVQLAVRITLAIVLGRFGITFGSLGALAYFFLPVLATIAITSVGAAYITDSGPQLWRVLEWLLRCEAYVMLLVDRLPFSDEPRVSIAITYSGHPTARSAMWRLVTSVPLVLVVFVLAIPSCVLWVYAAVAILLGSEMPHSILAFQLGVLRWQAQLLAYQASLVEQYPRWSSDTEPQTVRETGH